MTVLSRKPGGSGGGGAPSGPAGGSLAGTYPNPTVAAGAIDTAELAADAVENANIADDAVNTAQIADGAITNALLASNAPGWTIVRKTADQSIASDITVGLDDTLFFTAANGSHYEVEFFIIYGSPAGGGTPDMKFALGEDATVRGGSLAQAFNATGTLTGNNAAHDTSVTFVAGTDTTNRSFKTYGAHWGGGGSFGFHWSQNTSGLNATIVRAGSVLRYRLIS